MLILFFTMEISFAWRQTDRIPDFSGRTASLRLFCSAFFGAADLGQTQDPARERKGKEPPKLVAEKPAVKPALIG